MHKRNTLTAGIAIFLAGCQPTQNSRTWEAVKAAPHIGPGVPHRTAVYAQQLHKTLQRAGVEHKVVTFRFKYPSILKIDRVGEDVAVIYKDAGTPDHPWWLMAEYLWNPVWLPSGAVRRQVDFYVRRPASIVSVAEFRIGIPKIVKPHGKCVAVRKKSAFAFASTTVKRSDVGNRHSEKSGKRGTSRAPKSEPIPQVNPPTVRSRPNGSLRAA